MWGLKKGKIKTIFTKEKNKDTSAVNKAPGPPEGLRVTPSSPRQAHLSGMCRRNAQIHGIHTDAQELVCDDITLEF